MKKRWIIAGGLLCIVGLSYALLALREYGDDNRLKLFYKSVRIGMPKKEVSTFVSAYTVWLDPDQPEEEFIYEVDDTLKSDAWQFVQYSQARQTPIGTYSEIYHLEIGLGDGKVTTKKYWKTKCFQSPEWMKPRVDFARCF